MRRLSTADPVIASLLFALLVTPRAGAHEYVQQVGLRLALSSAAPTGRIHAIGHSPGDGACCAAERGFFAQQHAGGAWRLVPEIDAREVRALDGATGDGVLVLERRRLARLRSGRLETLTTLDGTEPTCISALDDKVWIGTRSGLLVFDGRTVARHRLPRALAESGSPAVRDVAVSSSGAVAIASGGGIWVDRKGGVWARAEPEDERRSWRMRDVRAIAFDRRSRLWIAAPQGVAVLDGASWRLFDERDGLPLSDFTSLSCAEDGGVWFGTTRGLIRLEPDRESWEYRQGRRWLPHDQVNALAVDATGGVFAGTAAGIGRVELRSMTLAKKAELFEREIDERHRRTSYGFVLGVSLARPGEIDTARRHDSDNDGLWTAMYGAGQCFAYGATKSAKSRERARAVFEALKFLGDVTQGGEHPAPPGFVARTVLPVDGPDPNAGRAERDRRFRATRDRAWKIIEPRWPKSADGKWYWKCDTSSDELDGHYFFYARYYDLVADTPQERARVRAVVTRLTDHLIDHEFNLVDHDGKPTRWGHFGPSDLNHDPQWWEERGLNSMSLLSYLKVAEHISGDAKYAGASRELIEKHGYAINVLYPKSQIGVGSGNQSDDEMAFMSFYNLLKYERDPKLRSIYAFAFQRYWRLEASERNPLFHFLFAAVVCNDEWKDPWGTTKLGPEGAWREDSIDTLERFPLDLVDWRRENSHRQDIVRLPPFLRPGVDRPRGVRRDGKVLPIDERYVEHWNHDPFVLDTGGSGHRLADGASFLLPYYLGLYHGFVR